MLDNSTYNFYAFPSNKSKVEEILLRQNAMQKRIERLQLKLEIETQINIIVDKIRASLDEKFILQTAVEELAIVLQADCCYIPLATNEQPEFIISYHYSPKLEDQESLLMTDFLEVYPQLLPNLNLLFHENVSTWFPNENSILNCGICDQEIILGEFWLFRQNNSPFSYLDKDLVSQVAHQCVGCIRQARLYQKAMDKIAELEKINSLKDDFLNTVAHEMRSPVTNMKMAIKMLEINQENSSHTNSVDKNPGKSKKDELKNRYLQILHSECDREINLINTLLDLQRVDAGYHPLDMKKINLQNWIGQIIEPFEKRTHKQEQNLILDISPETPPITSDLLSLERIITELLNNACKYTPAGEKITIASRIKSETIEISVINSGVEIAANHLPHIFDKFYRIPSADHWHSGGSGLGLSLVQKLTEYLGGNIQVNSGYSQTCFTIELPINPVINS